MREDGRWRLGREQQADFAGEVGGQGGERGVGCGGGELG